jgi:hypothetical protein
MLILARPAHGVTTFTFSDYPYDGVSYSINVPWDVSIAPPSLAVFF